MADLASLLAGRLAAAFDRVAPGADPMLRPSERADYQANGTLALAKSLGREPRAIADEVVRVLEVSDLCSVVEVSGPGFINLTLDKGFLETALGEVAADSRLGVPLAEPREIT